MPVKDVIGVRLKALEDLGVLADHESCHCNPSRCDFDFDLIECRGRDKQMEHWGKEWGVFDDPVPGYHADV